MQVMLTFQGNDDGFDYPDYLDISETQKSFDSLSVVSNYFVNMTGERDPVQLHADCISSSMAADSDAIAEAKSLEGTLADGLEGDDFSRKSK